MDKEERSAITDCVTRALRREQGDVLRRPDTALNKEGDVTAALAGRRSTAEVRSTCMSLSPAPRPALAALTLDLLSAQCYPAACTSLVSAATW